MQLLGTDLVCVRGGRQVFAGCNFAIASGQALVINGPNGAGKTSLLRMVAGLLRVEAGRIELQGGNGELTIAEQAHFLGHHDALKPSLSVGENLRFWDQYLSGGCSQTSSALDTVGLAGLADLPASFLSAGQRRRLSIARLVAVKRAIWLLDEPTSALDITSQKILSELMSSHLSSGGIIVAAAHGPIGLEHARELKLGLA